MYNNSFYHNFAMREKSYEERERRLLFNYIPTVPSFGVFQSF